MKCLRRVLVAGFGSTHRGDDSFGVVLLERVKREIESRFPGVEVLEAGTNGLLLVQQLMEGYDALVILDSVEMGGEPGRIYVLRVKSVRGGNPEELTMSSLSPLHEMNPTSTLAVAASLGVLPRLVYIVGLEPETLDYIADVGLEGAVKRSLSEARKALIKLLEALCSGAEP